MGARLLRIKQLLGVIVVSICAGCGQADWMSLDAKGTAGAAPAAPAAPPAPAATGSPAAAAAAPAAPAAPAVAASAPMIDGTEFSFIDYTFRLPSRFEQGEVPPGGPPNITTGVWRGVKEGDIISAFTTISILDAKEAAKSTSNMRQTLVNFSAGATDRMGIKIALRGPTQTMDANGFKISYFVWSGLTQQNSVDGAAYGFVDGDRVVCMLHIAYGESARQETSEITKSIASWKRK